MKHLVGCWQVGAVPCCPDPLRGEKQSLPELYFQPAWVPARQNGATSTKVTLRSQGSGRQPRTEGCLGPTRDDGRAVPAPDPPYMPCWVSRDPPAPTQPNLSLSSVLPPILLEADPKSPP